MNELISALLKDFAIDDIESAAVQVLIETNNIQVSKNKLILGILNKNTTNINNIKCLLKDKFSRFNLYELEKIFELLIPHENRKINGAFFTPSFVTEYITSELITSKYQTICDPSCGCGAFLIAAIKVLKTKFNEKITDIISNNIYGADILEYSVRRCKIILSLLALMNGEDIETFRFNIYQLDSLNANWDEKFPAVMKKGGFDIVIGNPPYVKYQDLPNKIRKELYKNWVTLKTGTYNLYFAFFELGIKIMKNDGCLGYITPNNYFTSLAGVHLREFLQINRYIRKIVDFNHLRLFDAQTYTCITFLSKIKNDYFLFERIDKEQNIPLIKSCKFSKIKYCDLDQKKWRLLRETDQINIKKIETYDDRLGSIVDIRVGVATCKDNVYFVDGATLKNGYYKKIYSNKSFLIEQEITKPIVKISDFKSQNEIDKNKRRFIFPYYLKDGKASLVSEDQFHKKYPRCYEYLLAAKSELESRDKGKVKYEVWYAYARTQGLTFYGEKLVTPTFSIKPRFLYVKDPDALFCNGYGIFSKKDTPSLFNGGNLDLKTLAKILNSSVMDYYINRTSVSIEGGYPCYQKNFIERFAIADLTKEDVNYLKKEKTSEKSNEFLIKKYGLTL